MNLLINTSQLLHAGHLIKTSTRKISKYSNQVTAKTIRRKFIDHFKDVHKHTFVRSSPIVPFYDPTVAFVNAGMNQFKGIFLGTQIPKYSRVVNSQKCVRVGGKHNDLNIVGTDGYHHTFFEMLGNWSFGDYFKEDACKMAWELLTEKYRINQKLLYVTYFSGDQNLGLAADDECKDIWLKIGVPQNRILPYGIKDNFWEMGPVGPCGPCTEIHVDHRGTVNRAKFVNKGLPDLTELWNIVFVQYNRKPDGQIEPLPNKHIDTGMGLERITAHLQGKLSNYDTDLFSGIIAGIHKSCKNIQKYRGLFGEKDWNRLDTSYRILADHVRMVTACLADGMIPEENQKLRRIIRKSFLICEQPFQSDMDLLKELTNYVVESLGTVYPEMEKQIHQIHQILDFEEEVFKQVRTTAEEEWSNVMQNEPGLQNLDVVETPGLVAAYKDIKAQNTTVVTPQMGFKLYDTFGLDEETIVNFTNALGLKFDVEGFNKELQKAKTRSKDNVFLNSDTNILDSIMQSGIPLTDDSYKYSYSRKKDKYEFDDLNVAVLKIVFNNRLVDEIESGNECSLILDKTSLYAEAGGQISDRGHIKFGESVFDISALFNVNGYILHKGFLVSTNKNAKLLVNSVGTMVMDQEFRKNNMRNHTATHLLNSAVKEVKGATCQKSSKVNEKYLNLDVGIFGTKLSIENLEDIEDMVLSVIQNSVEVKTHKINSQDLLMMDNVTLVPGEIYPDNNIRLIEIEDKEFLSREPCCGTHVKNTGDIEDFCIIGCRSLGRSTASLHAVTGDRAKLAQSNALEIVDQIEQLRANIRDNIDKPEVLDMAINVIKQRLKYEAEDDKILPLIAKHAFVENLNKISKQIKDSAKDNLKGFIEVEMKNVLETNKNKTKSNREYIVHYLRCSTMLDTVPLQQATKMCPKTPVLIISYSDNTVKARSCVPEDFVNEHFTAEKWLKQSVGNIFRSNSAAPKGQDPKLVCNMKQKKVNNKDWDTLLSESLKSARSYAEKFL